MSAIPFTDRELKRAWRELDSIWQTTAEKKNAHRLLLFYAVEAGLKAALLKRKSKSLFDSIDIENSGHDLRKILKELCIGQQFTLPENIQLEPIASKSGNVSRNGNISILHQAWRYGGKCDVPSDKSCEEQLINVLEWIKGELK